MPERFASSTPVPSLSFRQSCLEVSDTYPNSPSNPSGLPCCRDIAQLRALRTASLRFKRFLFFYHPSPARTNFFRLILTPWVRSQCLTIACALSAFFRAPSPLVETEKPAIVLNCFSRRPRSSFLPSTVRPWFVEVSFSIPRRRLFFQSWVHQVRPLTALRYPVFFSVSSWRTFLPMRICGLSPWIDRKFLRFLPSRPPSRYGAEFALNYLFPSDHPFNRPRSRARLFPNLILFGIFLRPSHNLAPRLRSPGFFSTRPPFRVDTPSSHRRINLLLPNRFLPCGEDRPISLTSPVRAFFQ